MNVALATPARRGERHGNRVTALRWAGHLRALGHRARLVGSDDGGVAAAGADLLVALHARRSAPAIRAFAQAHPGLPIVLALTGTDLYEDRLASDEARDSLARAARIVVLQPAAVEAVPAPFRDKVRVVVQSARAAPPSPPPEDVVQVTVLAHVRAVKDPLLAPAAARLLPPESRIVILHLGAGLEPELEARARAESRINPRYVWAGPRPRREALRDLAGSAALLVTSRLEGGANVVSEAVAAGVPVLSTRIDGTVGLLGAGYPGYFDVGDVAGLTRLLGRFERDEAFRSDLRAHVERARPLVEPARERAAWRDLLRELTG